MARIRFTRTSGGVQVGTSPDDVVTYRGEDGETVEVRDDVAALLVQLGVAEVVEIRPPRAAKKTRQG